MEGAVSQQERQGFAVIAGYPEFLKLFIGQTISRLGDSVDAVAMMWMAYTLTGSAAIMATVMFFNSIPNLLFGVFAGVLIDRYNRKLILVLGDLTRGAIVAAIAYLYFVGLMVPWYLFVATFLISTVEVFSSPARSAVIPALVEKNHLMTANSMFNLATSISEILGFSLASAIVGFWGLAAAIFLDALSFWLCALMTALTRIPHLSTSTSKLNPAQYWSEVKEGFEFLRTQRVVFVNILLAAFINFALAPVGVVFPLFSDKVLNAGAAGYGFMASALSFGALTGSLVVGQFGDRIRRKSPLIAGGLSGIGLGFLLLGFARIPLLAVVCCFCSGFSLPFAAVSLESLRQEYTPAEKLGRVSAFSRTLAMAGIPLGIMITGLLTEIVAPNIFFYITGLLIFGMVGIASLSPDFRRA